ncbi:MAG TPA: SPOR domain-containing protein [Candidatus Acidoferrales bacterium]|nr:SPOR domain-containing protein [Candidatus Acidoferrales bacterium]
MAEGRAERTIGSGHLVALFLGIVVLCCVFFILGYEMGRAQFERGSSASVAAKPAATAPEAAKEPPASTGWPSGAAGGGSAPGKAGAPATSAQPAKSAAPSKAPASSGGTAPAAGAASNTLKPPEIPRGSIVLQVNANHNESDALNLAKLLQEKGFPAFVLTPSTDNWYRVQVGPFADAKAADQAKAALTQLGFKPMVRH